MSSTTERHHEIIEKELGQNDRRVLLVEGSEDVKAYRNLFETYHTRFKKKVSIAWETGWLLTHAGNKRRLLDLLRREPDWWGLVDRDEWTNETIGKKERELPKLLVLPRFCMENYLIDPEEIWAALPEKQRRAIEGGKDELEEAVTSALPRWRRHGVLWLSITPLWSGLRALGFQEALLDPERIQDDDYVLSTLKVWHTYLEPEAIFSRFHDQLQAVERLSEQEQLRRWIHGKEFWLRHVHPVLNRLLGQVGEKERRLALWRTLPLPLDWDPLWDRLLPKITRAPDDMSNLSSQT